MTRAINAALLVAIGSLAACNHPTPRSRQQDALKSWTPPKLSMPLHAEPMKKTKTKPGRSSRRSPAARRA